MLEDTKSLDGAQMVISAIRVIIASFHIKTLHLAEAAKHPSKNAIIAVSVIQMVAVLIEPL